MIELLVPQVNTVGLVAHYKLWDGFMTPGKVFDYSLNGNTGILRGANTVPLYPGFAFDGIEGYIDTEATFQSTFRDSFTISLWMKATDGQKAAIQILCGSSNSAAEDIVNMQLRTTGELQLFYEANNVNKAAQSVTAEFVNGQNSWIHIVGVVDNAADQMSLYVDGSILTLDADSALNGNITGLDMNVFTTGDEFFIGARDFNGLSDLWFEGNIDDFMIFNVAKTAVEIKSIYELTRWRYGV